MHRITCFLPPYMLRQIAQNGTPAQRARAAQTLIATEQLRVQRALLPRVSPPAAGIQSVGKQRQVYNADYGSNLPGRLVRAEGDPPTSDAATDEAYDGSGATYDLFWNAYQRDSIDGNGLRLSSTVHYQQGYDNAFWNGQQMVYGDGDEDLPEAQRLFNRFTCALDVIAHELTHGITQYEAQLNYTAQPGALNESFSDVFGVLVKQQTLGQTAAQADWIIGAGLFTAQVRGVGIRSMQAPGTAYDDPVLGKDPQPAHMTGYVNTSDDDGGVHINSGIPNHAFYVVSREIGGYAWEKAGRIWYVALTDRLGATSNFQAAANVTYQVAAELYGANSLEQKAVQTGWAEVGITVAGGSNGSGNTGCLGAPTAWFASLFKK